MDIASTQKVFGELLKNIQHPRLGTVLGLHEEVGELSKNIMNWEMYGEEDKENLGEECADIFFSLIDVCNAYGIDLEAVSQSKLQKTKEKVHQWEEKYGQRLRSLREILDHKD